MAVTVVLNCGHGAPITRNNQFALLLTELGHEWLKYYEDTTYEFMKVKVEI